MKPFQIILNEIQPEYVWEETSNVGFKQQNLKPIIQLENLKF